MLSGPSLAHLLDRRTKVLLREVAQCVLARRAAHVRVQHRRVDHLGASVCVRVCVRARACACLGGVLVRVYARLPYVCARMHRAGVRAYTVRVRMNVRLCFCAQEYVVFGWRTL